MDIRKIIAETLREHIGENTPGEIKLNDKFNAWFSGSKIKEGGKPKILYHGTKSNFDTFKPSKSIGNQGETDQIEGIYLTDNKNAAEFFSLSDDERFVKQIFLSMKNPYESKSHSELKKELQVETLAEVNQKLREQGYDGLIIEKGFFASGGPFKLYLAFYPNQIKSIRNNGEWSNSENIYK